MPKISLSRTVQILLCLFALSSCGRTVKVNIPSTYRGYVYVISSNGDPNQQELEIDKNGIVYIADYCSGETNVIFTIDHKTIKPEPYFVETHFETSNQEGQGFSVNYSTFLYPLRPKKDYSNDSKTAKELIQQGKLDRSRLKSCE